MLNNLCEVCGKSTQELRIGFVSRENPSSAKVCLPCGEEVMRQYGLMGKCGQIVIQPVSSEVFYVK